MQGFDENSISKIKVYGRKGSESGGYPERPPDKREEVHDRSA